MSEELNLSDLIEETETEASACAVAEMEEMEIVEDSTEIEVIDETVADESGIEISDDASEVVEEVAEEEQSLDFEVITAYNFMQTYKNKIDNALNLPMNISTMPEGTHLLYVTNSETDAEPFIFKNCNKLAFAAFEPTKIIVGDSGIIAMNDNCRTYITKTNVIQYVVVNGSPVSRIIFKKVGVKSSTPKFETAEAVEAKDVEVVKLHIGNVAAVLQKKVKDETDISKIKEEMLTVMNDVVDINYLIKINNMMMDCGL